MRTVVDMLLEEIAQAAVWCNADRVESGERNRLGRRTFLQQLSVADWHAQIVRVGNVFFEFCLALLPRALALQLDH